MEGLIVQVVGYAAAAVGTSLMVPQLVRSLRTKRMDDISIYMLLLYLVNGCLWTAYGWMIASYPVVVCNVIALFIAVWLIVLKIRYSSDSAKP